MLPACGKYGLADFSDICSRMINQENFELVNRGMADASMTQKQRQQMKLQVEMIELLEQLYRITPNMDLPPMEFLFQLFDEPCFPKGELVALTGRAKSGKTFLLSILMTCALKGECLTIKRERRPAVEEGHTETTEITEITERRPAVEEPLRVLWYDTEQSKQSTLDILKNRIMPLYRQTAGEESVFPEERLLVFNVRESERQNRKDLLYAAISHYHPDLVIIDGIRDLVGDINDGVAAQDIMEELMRTAQREKCCIVCVLHQNKASESRDPRGWLGTELLNKAFDVFATEKLMPQRIFKLEQLYTRKYDIEQCLYFEVDDDGLPVLVKDPPLSAMQYGCDEMTEERPALNAQYVIHHPDGGWEIDVVRLFSDALKGRDMLTGAALRYQVKLLGSIATNRLYNNSLDRAMQAGLLEKWKEPSGRVCYRLRKQEAAKPNATEGDLFLQQEDAPPF